MAIDIQFNIGVAAILYATWHLRRVDRWQSFLVFHAVLKGSGTSFQFPHRLRGSQRYAETSAVKSV